MENSEILSKRRLYRLWSVIAFGAGTHLLNNVVSASDSPEEMYVSLTSDDKPAVSAEAVRRAKETPLSSAEKIMEQCCKKSIGIVTIDDNDYPERLRYIDFPPPVLFYRGDISGIDDNLSIGIVGARMPSDYSRRVTAGIVRLLAGHGFDIISGFAEGIDITSHVTAIKNGGRTYAVLGTGIDYNYPRNNMKYRDAIIANGAVITEFLPSSKPLSHNFPQRNRILAGLSMSIAVIEAGGSSGSLNTAAHAAEQGKTVFAVPPSDLFDSRYMGNTALIRDGAVPLMGARDIFGEYCNNLVHTIDENSPLRNKLSALKIYSDNAERSDRETPPMPSPPPSVKKHRAAAAEKAVTENTASAVVTLNEQQLGTAENEIQRKILSAMNGREPMRADDISAELSEDIAQVLEVLTELEIFGRVTAENGSYRIIG